MYRASATGGSPVPAVFLVVALILGVAGCGGSGHKDPVPTFGQSNILDKSYDRNRAIDGETLPAASGGVLTYTISPDLPAGLTFDAATRLLSGTPTAVQSATLYTYTATDSDAADPDSASLTFWITVEAVASVSISAEAEEVDEGDDRRSIGVTLTLSEAVTGEVAIALASTGTARLGGDFDLASAELTVAEGSTYATTTITPIRDLEAENDETISLEIDSVAGRGEIGSTPSVDIVIRDLGAAPPEGEYAAFEANLAVSDAIEKNAITLTILVINTGGAAASSTQAVLATTTAGVPPRQLASLPVHALEPNDWFIGTIRVPFNELVPGANNFFFLRVASVAEEDPAVVGSGRGGAVRYTAVFLTDGNRIPTTCTGFRRDTEPGTQDPLFGAAVVAQQHRPDVLRCQRRGGRPRSEHEADAGQRSNRRRRAGGRGGYRS